MRISITKNVQSRADISPAIMPSMSVRYSVANAYNIKAIRMPYYIVQTSFNVLMHLMCRGVCRRHGKAPVT